MNLEHKERLFSSELNHRALAYALLRITLGVVFSFYGFNKLQGGPGNFATGLQERFAEQLPGLLVAPFAWVLPFIEVTVGLLLIVGLFTPGALLVSGVLMIALVFGAVMEPSPPTVANNLLFAVIVFLLLFLLEYNRYSLDRWKEMRSGRKVGF